MNKTSSGSHSIGGASSSSSSSSPPPHLHACFFHLHFRRRRRHHCHCRCSIFPAHHYQRLFRCCSCPLPVRGWNPMKSFKEIREKVAKGVSHRRGRKKKKTAATACHWIPRSVRSHLLATHCCAAGDAKGGAITRRGQTVRVAWSILPVNMMRRRKKRKRERRKERSCSVMWVCTKAVRFASSHNFKQPMEGRWNWRVGVQQDTYIARNWNFGHFPKQVCLSKKKH